MKLKKIRNGYYYDTTSNRVIEKINNTWKVSNECHGQVYFEGKTLKECKDYQNAENEILNWNK